MAVTPTYSWPTPDDTDLVRDGAEAIRDLGDAIDTTVSEIDVATTKGDLLVYDGTDYQRLAVGTNDHILTADSGETTGVKWAALVSGGYTLITSGTFSSGTAVNLTSIPGTYRALYLVYDEMKTSGNATIQLRINNDTGSNYYTTQASWQSSGITGQLTSRYADCGTASSGRGSAGAWFFENYTSLSGTFIRGFHLNPNNETANAGHVWAVYDASTPTITQLNIVNVTGGTTFSSGSYALYGIS